MKITKKNWLKEFAARCSKTLIYNQKH